MKNFKGNGLLKIILILSIITVSPVIAEESPTSTNTEIHSRIYNTSSNYGDVSGDFIKNSDYSDSSDYAYGGAIYNRGVIGDINGDFTKNNATAPGSRAYGGAIYNGSNASIGNITGDFINNYVIGCKSGNHSSTGGAIYNETDASINGITGDFISNTIESELSSGAAIRNNGIIRNIKSNFVNNSNISVRAGGGIIYNDGEISSLIGDFTGNHSDTTSWVAYSGGIYNNGKIGNIEGKYSSNYAISTQDEALGGAIRNARNITSITGDFTSNYTSAMKNSSGGALYNAGTIGDISSNFSGNYAVSNGGSNAFGGAVYNSGTVTNGLKNATFNDNFAKSAYGNAKGGAIYTTSNLSIVAENGSSTFQGNYVQVGSGEKRNEAIYVSGASLNLVSRNNGTINMYDYINGEKSYTVNITGDSTGTLNLYNDIKNANVNVDTIKVNLADNTMHNYEFNKLTSKSNANYFIDIDFANKNSDKIIAGNNSSGIITLDRLRIANELTNPDLTYKIQILDAKTDSIQLGLSDSLKNQLNQDEYKIGVSVEEIFDTIKSTTNWNDKFNIYEQQNDIYGSLGLATTKTTNDSIGITISRKEGSELIYKENQGDTLALWNTLNTEERKNFNFDTSKDTYVVGKDSPETTELGETRGSELNINGVIEANTRSTIDLNNRKGFKLEDSSTLNIKNVTIANGYGKRASVIEATDSKAAINLTNVNLIQNTSNSDGAAIYSMADVNITADNSVSEISNNHSNDKNEAIFIANSDKTLTLKAINNGNLIINDSINGAKGYSVNITGDNTGMISLFNDINKANVSLGTTTLNTINDNIHVYNFNSFTLSDNAKIIIDVDLAQKSMDRISAETYGNHQGILSVIGMNLLSDTENSLTEIYFADKDLKDYVQSGLSQTNSYYQTIYAPIYKYDVRYDNREDAGYFLFGRSVGSSNPSDAFNPAVLDSTVSTQAGSQSALNETVKFAFQHMDTFSKIPSFQRMAIINQNKYAIKDVNLKYNSNFEQLDKGYWVKPFTTFERIHLHNGPSVDAITYGTLVGFDGNFRELKNGWYNVQSIYGGYVGSQMNYTGVDTSLNGGLLGLTETFYKGNFFGALTATAGATLADSSTMYGKEEFTSLLGGIGAKAGYNFEFKRGKYILQPIMFMDYSFVNTFDYTNSAKVRISSDPLHSIQINPQLKFVANLKQGWQPYASVGIVWNVLNSTRVKANDVILPRMSVDPYVEYGLGIQRHWKDKFTGYAQAMVRNGGRNGVALTFGFRWALGNEIEEL